VTGRNTPSASVGTRDDVQMVDSSDDHDDFPRASNSANSKNRNADTHHHHPASTPSTISNSHRFPLQYHTLYTPLHSLLTPHSTTYRHINKQIQICLKALDQLMKKEMAAKKGGSQLSAEQMQKNQKVFEAKMEDMIEKLRDLESKREGALHKLQLREEYLKQAQERRYREDCLWRLIVDFCAREGHFETVNGIMSRLKDREMIVSLDHLPSGEGSTTPANAKTSSNEIVHFSDLVSLEVYQSEIKIIRALQKHNCKLALKWCDENRSSLKKFGSSLEFELKLQEFIELVRKDDVLKAIEYARQNLTDATQQQCNLSKIKQAMGTIAFGPQTRIQPYATLFHPNRWSNLIEEFKRSNRMIHALSVNPELLIHLQAGISALKSPPSYDTFNPNDPLRHEAVKELAKELPFAFHDQSILRCAMSGDVMNDSNPPMALPNGNVYGLRALEDMSRRNGGMVRDPKTMETFSFNDLKKCFIMN